MKLKKAILFIGTSAILTLTSSADIIKDPIHYFAKFHELPAGSVIYQWEVDLNHDGRKELFLDVKPSGEYAHTSGKHEEPPDDPAQREFTVYIPVSNGAGYIEATSEFATSILTSRCFVGYITQLNKWGLVTIDLESKSESYSASAVIYAYNLQGDNLKLTNLAKYDPDKGSSPIYEQYLSDAHRTTVQLQEVAP